MANPVAGISMSLDEYIAKANIKRPPPKPQKNTSVPDRFRRCEEKDEESDDEMDDGLWRGPNSSNDVLKLDCDDVKFENSVEIADNTTEGAKTNEFPHADLRQKITGPLPDLKSQQWRLLYPNNNPERRSGMPPLVPQHLLNSIKTNNCQGRKRKRYRNYNNDSGSGRNNRNMGGNDNWSYGNRNNNNYNRNGTNRFGNCGMSTDVSSFGALNLNLLNQGLNALLRYNNANNNLNGINNSAQLSICQDASAVDLIRNPPLTRFEVNKPSTSANAASRANFMVDANNARNNSNVQQVINGNNKNEVEQSLVGINDCNALNIPMMATKFMEYLDKIKVAPVHKPFYDMKVQKEIHNMQDKPLIYKKSDTPVIISSDGAGIDCEIIPRSSGMSMNYRFT